jgi:long-chain acyl-CoA synthetase
MTVMNIGRLVQDNIQRFGEYKFVNFEGRWQTNVEMNRFANKLGNALKKMGIKKGDRVGIQLLNCPELLQAFFAIFKIGAILVPVNPSLRVHELAYLYQDAGMVALVSNVDYIAQIREARRDAPHLANVILTGKRIPKDAFSYDKIIQMESDDLIRIMTIQQL